MAKKYRVTLTSEERVSLEQLIGRGKAAARKLAHARILLKADEAGEGPGWPDGPIAAGLEVGLATVARVRQRYVEEGLEAALVPRPSPRVYARKLDGEGEAHLIALTPAPHAARAEGRRGRTLRLLAARMVALGRAEELSYETVRRVLKRTRSSRG